MGILKLEENLRSFSEPGGKIQTDPFEQEPIGASRFVSLNRKPVVGLISHPRLPAEIENQGSNPHIFQELPGFVLRVALVHRLPRLAAAKHRPDKAEHGEP
jgi:hypothetical protein